MTLLAIMTPRCARCDRRTNRTDGERNALQADQRLTAFNLRDYWNTRFNLACPVLCEIAGYGLFTSPILILGCTGLLQARFLVVPFDDKNWRIGTSFEGCPDHLSFK